MIREHPVSANRLPQQKRFLLTQALADNPPIQNPKSKMGCSQAIAAGCETLPIGPWDRKPQPGAGRLGNYLDIRLHNRCGTCPERSQTKKLPKNSKPSEDQ